MPRPTSSLRKQREVLRVVDVPCPIPTGNVLADGAQAILAVPGLRYELHVIPLAVSAAILSLRSPRLAGVFAVSEPSVLRWQTQCTLRVFKAIYCPHHARHECRGTWDESGSPVIAVGDGRGDGHGVVCISSYVVAREPLIFFFVHVCSPDCARTRDCHTD